MPTRIVKAKSIKRPVKPRSNLSPLLRSAFEVLEHGLWHYFRSSTTPDMKFALLHLDQAIELLLKECVRRGGRSIYKNNNPKETINIWSAYNILENELLISIPEKPDLELLHEERNNIQHKYSNPSPADAAFYVDKAMKFIKRFCKDQLGLEIADSIPVDYMEQLFPAANKISN